MKIITTEQKIKGYKFKVTQDLNEQYNFGHYNWVIENSNGDILAAGYSTGSPPNKLTKKEINEIFERWEID